MFLVTLRARHTRAIWASLGSFTHTNVMMQADDNVTIIGIGQTLAFL